MTLPRLKLSSSHGDQTFLQLRFVVHSILAASEAEAIEDNGLPFVEGRPVVCGGLDQALGQASTSQDGKVLVLAQPQQFHLGYGVFTTAYIDRALRRVVGAPLRYASSRRQLAFYLDREVEPARERIEAEVAEGYELDKRPSFVVEAQNIVGAFRATSTFHSLVGQLEVATQAFQPLDLDRLEASLGEFFEPAVLEAEAMTSSVVKDLIASTVETIVMSQLRLMRWQGLQLLGFGFFEDDKPVSIPAVQDLAEQRARIAQFQKALEAPQLFAGQLAWLRGYAATELRIMHVELDETL